MKAWRFWTILLSTVSASAAIAHLLEMPAKLGYDGPTWLHLLQTLYPPAFGPVSGTCEIAAVVAAVILAILLGRRGERWGWVAFGAGCLVIAHTIFWCLVSPVNAALVPLSPDTLPPNWLRLRNQWEYSHATRAVLQLFALSSFVISILTEIPASTSCRQGRVSVGR